jgi:acetyltransferase EpsM
LKPIIIFGAGGHAKVVLDCIYSNSSEVKAFFSDSGDDLELRGLPILSELPNAKTHSLVVAIGNNSIRKSVVERCKNFGFVNATHCSAIFGSNIIWGNGVMVMAGVVINCDTKIGSHVIVNTNSSIDHDCEIDDYVHISPNVALAGNVSIGEGTHIGIGASILPGVKIGKWATIGAGALILRDVPDYAVVVGIPGQIIKYNQFHER